MVSKPSTLFTDSRGFSGQNGSFAAL